MRRGAIAAVASHDLLDLKRQRGVWTGLLLIPAVTVTLLFLLPGVLAQRQQASAGRATYRVAVEASNTAVAQSAIDGLRLPRGRLQLGITVDARADVLAGRADLGLQVQGEVASDLAAEAPIEGNVLVATNRNRSRAALGVFTGAVERRTVAETRARLAARGLPPATAQPLVVDLVDLSDTSRGRRLGLAAILPLLVLLPLGGTVGIAAQRISGSKDRRVFEPLLALPFTRSEILAGKAAAAWAIGTISLAAVGLPLLVAMSSSARRIPVGAAGRSIALTPGEILGVIGIGAVLLTLLVAIGVTAGAASRTSAEIGSVLQLITLPIFLMGSLLQIRSGIATQPSLLVLPIFGPLLCIRDLALGALEGADLLLATAATIAWSALALAFSARMLQLDRSVVRSTS